MSYILKDHQGSMYATVTGNTVERYGFDAWGRRRNPQTLSYDNVSVSFDRGYTMHEHYDDFGLINMNGRMYDPLVGRMLSPDIVIQDPELSQAYNRYSYCLNNPLKFTDPSGYVTTIPPEFKAFYYSDILLNPGKYMDKLKDNHVSMASYDTELSEGKTVIKYSWRVGDDSYEMTVVDHGLKGEQMGENSCVADAFSAQEARFKNGNKSLTPEEIMSWKENSCENGLVASDIIPLFLEQSKIFYNITDYSVIDFEKHDLEWHEKRAYDEMNRNCGVFFSFHTSNGGHVVNASTAIQFSVDNQVKAHEIRIWDSGLDGGKTGGYRPASFYDLGKLIGKLGVFHKK